MDYDYEIEKQYHPENFYYEGMDEHRKEDESVNS